MDDVISRGGKRKIMINEDIKALMRKYNVQPHGDQLRLQKILDWDDGEVGKLKEAKPEILQYFQEKEAEKRRREEETLAKARSCKDGLFLIIEGELGYGIHVGAARWLTEEEKPHYSEWFRETGMVGAGSSTTLDRLTFEDMPKRETDGSLLSSSASVWIISPEEYDRYIALNDERDRKVKEQEEEEERLREEKRAAAQREKEALLAKVDTWDISSRTITDEGGRTQVHTHIFQIGGEKLVYTERNVFDFGIVINPAYQVAEDVEVGGIALEIDGVLQWHTFGKDLGWVPVRPLTEHEKICHEIIAKYGKYAGWNIRM